MKVMHLLENRNQYLYEDLENAELRSIKLWESAGYAIKEAALTPDQIQNLFAEIEKAQTASGNNRTTLGKGKDATVAIKKAYDDLISKVQNSKPVKGADAMYDSAVAKIEAGLGGSDNAVNQVIQKYRKFAKEHPVAQSLIYSILIAAAGISGVGLGGAAVLGLLKMADKLLQGEKFSTAVGKGLATGATAYAAGQIGQALKGTPTDAGGADASAATSSTPDLAAIRKKASDEAMKAVQDALDKGVDPNLQGELSNIAQATLEKYSTLNGGPLSVQSTEALGNKIAMQAAKAADDAFGTISQANDLRKSLRGESKKVTGQKLSEGQVYLVFNRIVATNNNMLAEGHLIEGPLDAIKSGFGKAVNWAKTKGKNLTTKVTADKLNSAWQGAGAPTDSEELKQFLTGQGVEAGVVDSVYTTLKISSGAAEEPAAQSMYAQIKKDVQTLDKKGRQRIMAYLQKQLGTA
jgi:hypothetical protein